MTIAISIMNRMMMIYRYIEVCDSRRPCEIQAHVYHLSVQRVTDLTSNRVGLDQACVCSLNHNNAKNHSPMFYGFKAMHDRCSGNIFHPLNAK